MCAIFSVMGEVIPTTQAFELFSIGLDKSVKIEVDAPDTAPSTVAAGWCNSSRS